MMSSFEIDGRLVGVFVLLLTILSGPIVASVVCLARAGRTLWTRKETS